MRDPRPPRCSASGVRTRERVAAAVGGATYINLTSRICGGFPCRVVTDDILMFRDAHHLTNTYAATLWDVLGRLPWTVRWTSPPRLALVCSSRCWARRPLAAPSPGEPASPVGYPGCHPRRSRRGAASAGLGARHQPEHGEPAVPLQPGVRSDRRDPPHRPRPDRGGLPPVPDRVGLLPTLSTGLRVTDDGGAHWHEGAGLPWAGTGRAPNWHATLAWGPGPTPGHGAPLLGGHDRARLPLRRPPPERRLVR